jgi:hypothetical protein
MEAFVTYPEENGPFPAVILYMDIWGVREELYDIVDDPSFFHMPRQGAPAGALAPPAQIPPHVLEERQARLRKLTEARCLRTAAL